MAIHQRISLAAICVLVLGACGGGAEPAAPPDPPPVKDTVFGDMAGTMDKARGVQDTVNAQKQELDRQVQAAEGEE
jgi:hypothetical protein